MNISYSWHHTWLTQTAFLLFSLIPSHFQRNKPPLISSYNQITWIKWIKGFSSHVSYWQNCTTLNSYATTSCKLPWDQAAPMETCGRFHTWFWHLCFLILPSVLQITTFFPSFFLDSKAALQNKSPRGLRFCIVAQLSLNCRCLLWGLNICACLDIQIKSGLPKCRVMLYSLSSGWFQAPAEGFPVGWL